MRGHGRSIHIRWWVWPALIMVALAATAVGIGWFPVVLVGMAWLAVTLFNQAAGAARPENAAAADAAPQPRELLAQPRTRLDATLSRAPSGALCQLWEQTSTDLRRTYLPSTVCSYAELREAILDELSKRHPDGVRRWLDDQPDSRELSAYLQHHR